MYKINSALPCMLTKTMVIVFCLCLQTRTDHGRCRQGSGEDRQSVHGTDLTQLESTNQPNKISLLMLQPSATICPPLYVQ